MRDSSSVITRCVEISTLAASGPKIVLPKTPEPIIWSTPPRKPLLSLSYQIFTAETSLAAVASLMTVPVA